MSMSKTRPREIVYVYNYYSNSDPGLFTMWLAVKKNTSSDRNPKNLHWHLATMSSEHGS